MIYENKLFLAVSIFSLLINLLIILPNNLEASTVKYEQIELNSTLGLDKFVKVEEGVFDPKGTYVLKSMEEEFIKIRMDDFRNNSEKEIEKSFQKKIIQFSLLFQDRVSPYKGAITTNAECFDKSSGKKIIKNEKEWLVTFNTVATKNFAYGKCDGEGQMFFSKYQVLYCRKVKKIFDVRFFAHKKKDLEGFQIKCLE